MPICIYADYNNYLEAIRFKNYETAILGMLNSAYIQQHFIEFYNIMVNDFLDKYKKIMEQMDKDQTDNVFISVTIYKMDIHVKYSKVRENLETSYVQLLQFKKMMDK